MRRTVASVLVIVVAVGGGFIAMASAPSRATELEAKLAAMAISMTSVWTLASGPSALNELSVAPWFRCFLPTSSLFGDEIANEHFRDPASGEKVSVTIGFARAHNAARASRLLRRTSLDFRACLHVGAPRRTGRAVPYAFVKIQPFEDAVGWTSYYPPKPFTAPRLRWGDVVANDGIRLGPHQTQVFYAVLRDGYIAESSASGALSPWQDASIVNKLAAAL
jgi:hypothetical protein